MLHRLSSDFMRRIWEAWACSSTAFSAADLHENATSKGSIRQNLWSHLDSIMFRHLFQVAFRRACNKWSQVAIG